MFTTSTNLTNRHYVGRSGATPIIIGIHTMEAREAGNTAEAVANYFKMIDASAHWCVDDNSRVRVVNDEDAAWTMPPLNNQSLNIEMAGYASQSPAQWADAYSQQTLDIVALCVAEWSHKYGIPIRHLNDSQIHAYNKGIVGHVDVNRVFHASDHTDPGPNFPWGTFLHQVLAHYDNMPQPKPAPTGSCKALQQAIGVVVDGDWGPDTDKHLAAIRDAASDQFPYGVSFAQTAVKASPDGAWGPLDKAALVKAIARVQAALKVIGYDPKVNIAGIWGSGTEKAFQAARNHFHV